MASPLTKSGCGKRGRGEMKRRKCIPACTSARIPGGDFPTLWTQESQSGDYRFRSHLQSWSDESHCFTQAEHITRERERIKEGAWEKPNAASANKPAKTLGKTSARARRRTRKIGFQQAKRGRVQKRENVQQGPVLPMGGSWLVGLKKRWALWFRPWCLLPRQRSLDFQKESLKEQPMMRTACVKGRRLKHSRERE